VNDSLALLLLTGLWAQTTESGTRPDRGWCTREHDHIKCGLCGGKVDSRDVPGHGRQHIAAIEGQYASFWVVLSMATMDKAKLYKRDIGDVIEEVFGFRPGTPEATQFWKDHGGTAPC
jgi:hypothetical protein